VCALYHDLWSFFEWFAVLVEMLNLMQHNSFDAGYFSHKEMVQTTAVKLKMIPMMMTMMMNAIWKISIMLMKMLTWRKFLTGLRFTLLARIGFTSEAFVALALQSV